MIDTIIESPRIFDGAGTTPTTTDLALVGDRIALIGDLSYHEARERINARGLTLAPGFIDAHAHTDELWLINPRCEGKILQGVTTEIGGNCGSSIAPLHGYALKRKQEELAKYHREEQWQSLDAFFSLVEHQGIALNIATLIGLGTTRRGVRADREGKLDLTELREQRALVREGIEQGGLGVSSGLIYVPSRYADLDELIACASEAREAGQARYASHIRDEADGLLEAVDEAIEIGRRAEVAVQCSHHKASGKKNWGKVHDSLNAIERARAKGFTVYTDVYPYTAMWTDLSTILPEALLFGGREETLTRLRDPAIAGVLSLSLELALADTWHDIMITSGLSEPNAHLAGLRMDTIARAWRLRPSQAALRLLIEERLDPQAIFFSMREDDVQAVLSASFTCIGSDASARALSGITAQGVPHPRTYGTFPRIFGNYVRRHKTFELSEAVHRMTAIPADIFGLRDRGRITPGAYADLVLFDASSITDTATYESPCSAPIGITAVFVNGQAVVRDGQVTGALPGRVLRGGG
jgi:N-acyl-D-amino-acid deacylase